MRPQDHHSSRVFLSWLLVAGAIGCSEPDAPPWDAAPGDLYADGAGLAPEDLGPPPDVGHATDTASMADGGPGRAGDTTESDTGDSVAPPPPVCLTDDDCDDGAPCTVDLCTEDPDGSAICAHEARVCEGPDEPCLTTSCDPGVGCASSLTSSEACCFETVLADLNFESPGEEVVTDLTVGGAPQALWHLSQARALTGESSYLFAIPEQGSFDNGHLVAGRLTLPRLALPTDAHAALRFHAWPDVEADRARDTLVITVDDGTGPLPVWAKREDNLVMATWNHITVDLAAFAGSEIWISFTFSSVDHAVNDGEGLYLDDVWVWTTCASPGCETDADCEDGVTCTVQACAEGLCTYGVIAECCALDGDCYDGDHCTADTCEDGTCVHTPVSNTECCNTSADCDDDNPCTADLCVPGAQYTCEHQVLPAAGCCATVADCLDDNPCTTETCEDAQCQVETTCCSVDADCDDGDALCTLDSCVDAACAVAYTLAEGCCPDSAYATSFETGADGWTLTDGGQGCAWAVDGDGPAKTGTHALHYGACGTSAAARSPSFVVPGGTRSSLSTAVWMDIDSESDVDTLSLWLLTAEGAFELWQQTPVYGMEEWHTIQVELSAFGGQSVAIEWRFDTVTSVPNEGAGVFIDDVALTSTCTPAACTGAEDCDDDLSISDQACVDGACVWTF